MLSTRGFGRLQVKLLLLVQIASLPALFLLFSMAVHEREAAVESSKADLTNMARLASINRERYFLGAQQVLATVARTPLFQTDVSQRCNVYLQDLAERIPVFFYFGVFDGAGHLRCTSRSGGVNAETSDGSFFRRDRDNVDFSVSPYMFDSTSRRKSLQFGQPLFDHVGADHQNGVIFGSIDLAAHEQSLAGLLPETLARVVFTDHDGIILSSYPAEPEKIGTRVLETQLLETIRASKTALSEEQQVSGTYFRATDVVRIGNVIAMHTILTMPLNVIAAKSNRRFYALSAALVAALSAVMLIAWWLGDRWIVRRARLISDAALRIGQGEHGVRTRFVSQQDELDQVGLAFDRMAEALERREADLLITNRWLANAQRIAKLGHWEFDLSTNRGWWSTEYSEIFSEKASDYSFEVFLEWVHPDDKKRVADAYARIVATKAPTAIEYRTVGKHGRLRWLHVIGECVGNDDGPPVKLFGIIQDITDRKKVEASLKLLEAAVSSANDMILITEAVPVDETGPRIVFVNDALEKRAGYSKKEVVGKSPRLLQEATTSRESLTRIRAAMKSWTTVREALINYSKVGMPFRVELDIAPIADETGLLSHWVAIGRDITETKNAATALVASEERYRLLFNANPLPIVMFDATTLRYVNANETFCHQYGYVQSELQDQRVTDRHIPKTFESLRSEIQALPIGISILKGVRHVKRDGSLINVEVTRIKTEIDGQQMLITSPLDVTDRVLAENALKASEERYRQLFESNPLPLWVYDLETLAFLDVNNVACERYGYSRDEFLAMTMCDIRPAEDIATFKRRIPHDGTTRLNFGPWRHRRKDGTVMMVEINSHDVNMHGRKARFVCPIEVTQKLYVEEEIRRMNLLLERKVELRTEELARSLALQQSLFDNVPQIVWLADLNGSITFANRIWSEKIGLVADEWRGEGWSRALHPEDLDRVMQEWLAAAPVKASFEIEYRLLHRDGGYHHYEVNARRTLTHSGEPICWVGICSDVTNSRRREEALRFANQELEAFSYSVSHDLRAPLRAIDGFSERLQLESAERIDVQGRHYLDRIRAGAANMNRLIDDLLSLSQVTRGSMAMSKVDLSMLARQVFDELRQREPGHPAKIVIMENMTARGDAHLLRILFVNLIGNALKFSGKREISRIEVGETTIGGNISTFFVRDNGAGFDPAYSSKIFGVFQRLHSAAEFPGTGIGLATVQRIVHRHGGHVSAQGTLDVGATIYFSLRGD